MDAVMSERRYLKIAKLYLSFVGIWPEQNIYNQYILRIIIYVVMLPCLLAQIAHVVYFFNLETITNQLFIIVTASMSVIKHAIYTAKYAKFKVLLDGMIKDLETDKTREELDVMFPYLKRAMLMATFYAYGTMTLTGMFIQKPLWPIISDIVAPLNTTRPRADAMELYYYFIDAKDCYYWTMLHIDISLVIIGFASVACDNFYIYSVQHACGLFELAGYRFKCAIEDFPNVRETAEMSKTTYRKVCYSIKAHNRAIGYVREIDSFYYGLLFVAIGITVIAFSSSLLWVSKLKPSQELYVHMVSLFAELWHILFLTIQGQFVINRTDSVYNQIYEGLWYNSVPKTQVLFILALRAGMDPPQITAGGIIPMNLQTFAEVVKLSFSYFTVLQSV